MFSKAQQSNKTPAVREALSPVTKPEQQSAPSSAPSKAAPSIISADLSISGDLVSAGEIQIDGKVEGDIRCNTLMVGPSGSVTGEVSAEKVRLHGTVTGRIKARSVFLASSSRMIGDVLHETLAVEPGAYVDGRCSRMEGAGDAERAETVRAMQRPRFNEVVGKPSLTSGEPEIRPQQFTA